MDLQAALPMLLPKAIAWAGVEARALAAVGQSLSVIATGVARSVGVVRPELIRVALVDALPMPADAMLRTAAVQTGLLGPHMDGLTLGYSVFVRRRQDTWRLYSHEFRPVFQYEQAGSIAAFLPAYLQQILQFGYHNAPLEVNARSHERHAPYSLVQRPDQRGIQRIKA